MAVLAGLSATADNYPALQSALSTGGFDLPPGVWPLSKALVPPVAATINGMNSYRSVLQMTTPGQAVIAMVDGQRLSLGGVGLTGPGKGNGSAPGVSIKRVTAQSTPFLHFDDVIIQQVGGNGIDAPAGNIIVSSFNRVVCEVVGGIGFNLTGVPGASAGTSLSLNACYANACGKAGYVLAKMCYTALTACACDSSGAGYVLEQCAGISLNACGTEGVVASGTDMYSDGTSFRVDQCDGIDFGDGCWTYGNSHYVLRVSGGSMNVRAGRIGENSPAAMALGHTLVDSGSQLN